LRGDTADHGVVAREYRIIHDPNGKRLNGLEVPKARLAYGLRVLPANAPKRDNWGKAIR
jgi:hypothetical protein